MKRVAWIFREVFSVVLQNWSTLLCFEMIYRGIVFVVLFPLLSDLLHLFPRILGQAYLGQENIALISQRPVALLLLLGIVLLTGFSIFFEITALFIYAEKGWRRERVSVWSLLFESAVKTMGLLQPKRLPVLFMLPVMTLSVFALLSGYLRTVKVPEFLMDYIMTNQLLLGIFVTVVVLCHLALFLYIFGFPVLLFSKRSFVASCKESFRMLYGKKLQTAGVLCGCFFLFLFVMVTGGGVGIFLIYVNTRFSYPRLETAKDQFELYFQSFQELGDIAAGAFISAFICAVIVVLYHQYCETPRAESMQQFRTIRQTVLRVVAAFVTLSLLLVFSESELGGRVLYPETLSTRIVAHRAGAAFGPENTVAALLQAAEDGADMAEIDVQQLGDGTLVVMHDTNFKRTTGVDLDVWDADIEMVQGLEAGSFFSSNFAGEPVATLDDMLSAAKGRIDLMIELKSSGREQNLVQETLTLIAAHGMEKQCVIASMDVTLLKQVKVLAPEMQTVLISVLLLADEYALKDVDAYSVETTALNINLVVQAHLQGKQVHVWTTNSEKTIDRVLSYDVDGLITDNPLLAGSCIDGVGQNYLMTELTNLLFPQT